MNGHEDEHRDERGDERGDGHVDGRGKQASTEAPADWPRLLSETAEACLAVLERGTDADWSRPAGGLEWSCRETLDHLALGLVGYAGLLIARPTDRFITLLASLDPQAPVSGCLEGIGIASKLLTTTVRGTGPEVRAWHPWGNSDPAGFAAMGIVELSMHTHDITQGLGLDWTPPEAASAAAVARLFPEAPEGHTAADTLLWSTGRTNLTGLPRRTSWQWYGAPR